MGKVTDKECFEFLQDLDDREDIDVSSWEAEFIESTLQCQKPDQPAFSDAQRSVIARMMEKYE